MFQIFLAFSHHDAPGAPSNYGAIIANSAHFQFCQTPQGSLLEARAMDPYGPFLDCKGFSIFPLHLERITPQRSQGCWETPKTSFLAPLGPPWAPLGSFPENHRDPGRDPLPNSKGVLLGAQRCHWAAPQCCSQAGGLSKRAMCRPLLAFLGEARGRARGFEGLLGVLIFRSPSGPQGGLSTSSALWCNQRLCLCGISRY